LATDRQRGNAPTSLFRHVIEQASGNIASKVERAAAAIFCYLLGFVLLRTNLVSSLVCSNV